jgi:hypothetical protein
VSVCSLPSLLKTCDRHSGAPLTTVPVGWKVLRPNLRGPLWVPTVRVVNQTRFGSYLQVRGWGVGCCARHASLPTGREQPRNDCQRGFDVRVSLVHSEVIGTGLQVWDSDFEVEPPHVLEVLCLAERHNWEFEAKIISQNRIIVHAIAGVEEDMLAEFNELCMWTKKFLGWVWGWWWRGGTGLGEF